MEPSPLYHRDPLKRFSDRATDYARFRPTYPPEAIAALIGVTADPHALTAADIGAGTGISSRLLADRGVKVWAVEPNAAMRDAAEPHPRVEWRDATAEQTGLDDRSVERVTCCQAFHWFEPDAALKEFQRILKPTGRVALMWNDRHTADPFTAELTEVIYQASDRTIFDRKDRKSPVALQNSPLFQNFQAQTFDWGRSLTLEELIGLLLSASYVPNQGEARDRLVGEVEKLFQQWATTDTGASTVTLAYRTYLYLADKAD